MLTIHAVLNAALSKRLVLLAASVALSWSAPQSPYFRVPAVWTAREVLLETNWARFVLLALNLADVFHP